MTRVSFIVLLLSAVGFTALSQMKHDSKGPKAVAVLHPTQGSTVSGIVTFEATDEGIRIVATISGLSPGKHGFHIHEYGDCSAPDATSAGGHFNPGGMPHSGPMEEKRHVGDLGNIEADKDGNARLEYIDPHLSFVKQNSIIGRGVVVHEKEDDLKTQPTGAAGGRLACGVIGVMKN